MKKLYSEPEIALFRLSAVAVITSSEPDPNDWETEMIGVDDYNGESDDA